MARNLRASISLAVVAGLLCAAAVASTRSIAPAPAASAASSVASSTLPWWKRSLSHTVQEEWTFALQMDQQYGARWRTALPDKVVARMYESWTQQRSAAPGR